MTVGDTPTVGTLQGKEEEGKRITGYAFTPEVVNHIAAIQIVCLGQTLTPVCARN